MFRLKTPPVAQPECYGRYHFQPRRCFQCMVDVACHAGGLSAMTSNLPVPNYTAADAAKRLVLSEAIAKEALYVALGKRYKIARSSAMTYTRGFNKWNPPSGLDDALKIVRHFLLGRSAKIYWLDASLKNGVQHYLSMEFPAAEAFPVFATPFKAKKVITGVEGAEKYMYKGRFRDIYVIKHPFQDKEDPDIVDQVLAATKYYTVQYWRFPRAPLHVAILHKRSKRAPAS